MIILKYLLLIGRNIEYVQEYILFWNELYMDFLKVLTIFYNNSESVLLQKIIRYFIPPLPFIFFSRFFQKAQPDILPQKFLNTEISIMTSQLQQGKSPSLFRKAQSLSCFFSVHDSYR